MSPQARNTIVFDTDKVQKVLEWLIDAACDYNNDPVAKLNKPTDQEIKEFIGLLSQEADFGADKDFSVGFPEKIDGLRNPADPYEDKVKLGGSVLENLNKALAMIKRHFILKKISSFLSDFLKLDFEKLVSGVVNTLKENLNPDAAAKFITNIKKTDELLETNLQFEDFEDLHKAFATANV